MNRRFRQFAALPGRTRIELMQAALLLIPVTLLLRFLTFQKTQMLLERTKPRVQGDPSAADFDDARHLGHLIGIAARHGPIGHATCLQRSLTLWWMLRRRGISADLRIGVRRKDGFEAHAWVEVQGRPVNDSDDVARRFAPFEIGELDAPLVGFRAEYR